MQMAVITVLCSRNILYSSVSGVLQAERHSDSASCSMQSHPRY
jgi:hypothetical protein